MCRFCNFFCSSSYDETASKANFHFNFQFKHQINRLNSGVLQANEYYFISHVCVDDSKFEELQKKDAVLAKICACQTAICEFLKEPTNKIYVIFLNPVKQAWLGYCKLIPYSKQTKQHVFGNMFEFHDKNNLVKASFQKM
jgi:hypothetical protein